MFSRVATTTERWSTDTEYKLRLGEIQNGRSETGSGNNFAHIIG
jgi:hypothetical protein